MSVISLQGYRGKLVAGYINSGSVFQAGTVLDLFKDEDIILSNNSTEVFDLGAVPAVFSKSILLPGSKVNNEFFQDALGFELTSPDVWRSDNKVRAYLDFDGIYLVDGYIQLNKVNLYQNKFVDSYEVSLFGVISNLSVDLRTKFLTDTVGLRKFNHTASWDNVSASWAGELFSGSVVYQIADSGQKYYYSPISKTGIDEIQGAITVQDLRPAIRVKDVWDSIITDAGYTYSSSFWDQPWLNSVYLIANNNKSALVISGSDIEKYGTFRTNTIVSRSIATTNQAYELTSIGFNSKEFDTNNKYNEVSGTYHLDSRTPLRGKIRLNFMVTGSIRKNHAITYPNGFELYVNGIDGTPLSATSLDLINNLYRDTIKTAFDTSKLTVDVGNSDIQFKQEFNLEQEFSTFVSIPSGSVKFSLYVQRNTAADMEIILDHSSNKASYFEITKQDFKADGGVIDIPENMPFGETGIKQLDFINALQKKFCLSIYPDKTTPNKIICETFNNWYKEGDVKDFNKYINELDTITIEPLNNYTINKVTFTDKEDKDYISSTFTDTYGRTYGAAFYNDTSSYYSQGDFIVETAISSAPLVRVPGSAASGSAGSLCLTYKLMNIAGAPEKLTWQYLDCSTGLYKTSSIPAGQFYNSQYVCSPLAPTPYDEYTTTWGTAEAQGGNCGVSVGQPNEFTDVNKMIIPYYINNATYSGSRVNPRLMFYNGMRPCYDYRFRGSGSSGENDAISFNSYPYFDNYSAVNPVEGPSTSSLSLLFTNETPAFGITPTSSLLDTYWNNYLDLYYNSRAKIIKASAVIPLEAYFQVELNDLAFYRGNYYHIRAINDYSLTSGECKVELLGPVIENTLSWILGDRTTPIPSGGPTPTPTPTPTPSPTPTPTPTNTPSVYSMLLNDYTAGNSDAASACSAFNSNQKRMYYSAQPFFTNGMYMYTNPSLTAQVPDGYYSDGTDAKPFASSTWGGGSTAC